MVVVASPQPNELEQKKRKQTLERAKANHLSKQLQMRLQYAKLKVEYGWQRQNLNEVENLYFHHSHLRHKSSLRQGHPPAHADLAVQSGVPDRPAAPSPSASDPCTSLGSTSPPSSEHAPTTDGQPQPTALSSQHPPLQSLTPAASATSTMTNRPPSAVDLSDPNILARLAQLQAQVQMSMSAQSSSQSQTLAPPNSAPASTNASQPVSVPIPAPGVFPPHAGFAFAYPPGLLGTFPLGPMPPASILSASPNPALTTGSQPSAVPTSGVTSSTVPVSTSTSTPIPAPSPVLQTIAPIAPTALTYDSFWSTHASSAGATRALYRTHTGFTTSAMPGGNVAMLTPGGHTAMMTAEGVYVGGAGVSGKSG